MSHLENSGYHVGQGDLLSLHTLTYHEFSADQRRARTAAAGEMV